MVEIVAVLGGADCERIRSGWLAQPANAVSSLSYMAVGLWLLGRSRAPGADRGSLVAAGAAMVAVGFGSFAYHGPQPGWAHPVHNATILTLALALAGAHIRLATRTGAGVIAPLVKAWRPAAGWIAVALVAYWAGRTGSRFCTPSAVWQPHAVWHALSAVGIGLPLATRGPVRSARSRRT